jgi:hypothetical protein
MATKKLHQRASGPGDKKLGEKSAPDGSLPA